MLLKYRKNGFYFNEKLLQLIKIHSKRFQKSSNYMITKYKNHEQFESLETSFNPISAINLINKLFIFQLLILLNTSFYVFLAKIF